MKKIGFIGQGYVGKNYADDFEKRKYEMVRYSIDPQYIKNKERLLSCDIVFIAVPTPTTPDGFDQSIVESVLSLVAPGKIAVIKSTILPGETSSLQKKYPDIIVLHSPEFLSENTAALEAMKPFSNIVGLPEKSEKHMQAAQEVLNVLPSAPFSLICTSTESEIIKYVHNCAGYVQIIFFNLLYDFAKKMDADWEIIEKAISADPFIPNRYASPIHKSGRGAGGHCFIKDFAAFKKMYQSLTLDQKGISVLKAIEDKNIDLLLSSHKDLDLLSGVYGDDILKK
ncbi:MAG: hypothetical protein A2W64_00295 [Candidatus Zambryskibacteria bacterium RIFCSPLOWO2_02_39_10]|uniref:UDP-glucose/GDP-mannose dehydrogenase dimerisation domain-containing protein n=1 Tax=Candidatus Zambryskibacteria bacterium RIFCSPHIGHO2_02_38_10.5 TaxID=1802742 RepID=A0A1G2T8D9_9BACT|nr:MAG: UDP-glucose/GDP-mannose dehydrogenase dimerization [Parcubacteria group bacterium GW2011_GWA2_40_14]OHA93029.1 MAG: hypothetical protein A2W58_02055 [Candidatus Zambryskibacteria bacterium RIFCSPHIGHO2_02_38_10.5]OHB07688.1 MAG: hypothetical protein A2W64_00295 [Candidatus Zambryskibacteria bacterium RIFCSPLOWO2_02_39_10]